MHSYLPSLRTTLRKPGDGVTIPTFWVAVALSVLLHLAVMWKWLPHIRLPSLDDKKPDDARGSLVVRLAPPPRPPSPPPGTASPPPSSPPLITTPAPAREARPVARPQAAPPVIALNRPAPELPAVPPPAPPVAAPAPPRPPAESDFAADIEARRRSRNASAAPAPPAPPAFNPGIASAPQAEDDRERRNRAVAANLATRKQAFGYDPSKSGGIFELRRVGPIDAEFVFYGWDKGIRRNTMQLIEVQKGNNSDTRIAIIRRMIAIIRDNAQEDFLWESQRLQRVVTLSPRLRDNAGLEEFLMREFFPDDPRGR